MLKKPSRPPQTQPKPCLHYTKQNEPRRAKLHNTWETQEAKTSNKGFGMLCDDAQSTENQNSERLDGLHKNQGVLTIQTKKEPVGREKVFAATYWLGNDALNTQRPPSTTATENPIIKWAVYDPEICKSTKTQRKLLDTDTHCKCKSKPQGNSL